MNRKVKQLHEIVDSPNYEGKDIHPRPNDWAEFAVNSFTYEEGKSCDTEAITVILGSVSAENALHSLDVNKHRILE